MSNKQLLNMINLEEFTAGVTGVKRIFHEIMIPRSIIHETSND